MHVLLNLVLNLVVPVLEYFQFPAGLLNLDLPLQFQLSRIGSHGSTCQPTTAVLE
jgi:hypothetical protein